jgi:hypothetical protein
MEEILANYAPGAKARVALEKALRPKKPKKGDPEGSKTDTDPGLATILNCENKLAPALANSKGFEYTDEELSPNLVKYALNKSKTLDGARPGTASDGLGKKDRAALKADLTAVLSTSFMMLDMHSAHEYIREPEGVPSHEFEAKTVMGRLGQAIKEKAKDALLGKKVEAVKEGAVDVEHEKARDHFVRIVLQTKDHRKHAPRDGSPRDVKKIMVEILQNMMKASADAKVSVAHIDHTSRRDFVRE